MNHTTTTRRHTNISPTSRSLAPYARSNYDDWLCVACLKIKAIEMKRFKQRLIGCDACIVLVIQTWVEGHKSIVPNLSAICINKLNHMQTYRQQYRDQIVRHNSAMVNEFDNALSTELERWNPIESHHTPHFESFDAYFAAAQQSFAQSKQHLLAVSLWVPISKLSKSFADRAAMQFFKRNCLDMTHYSSSDDKQSLYGQCLRNTVEWALLNYSCSVDDELRLLIPDAFYPYIVENCPVNTASIRCEYLNALGRELTSSHAQMEQFLGDLEDTDRAIKDTPTQSEYASWLCTARCKLKEREMGLLRQRLDGCDACVRKIIADWVDHATQTTIANLYEMKYRHQLVRDESEIVSDFDESIRRILIDLSAANAAQTYSSFDEYFKYAREWFEQRKMEALTRHFWVPVIQIVNSYTEDAAAIILGEDRSNALVMNLLTSFLSLSITKQLVNGEMQPSHTRPALLIPAAVFPIFLRHKHIALPNAQGNNNDIRCQYIQVVNDSYAKLNAYFNTNSDCLSRNE